MLCNIVDQSLDNLSIGFVFHYFIIRLPIYNQKTIVSAISMKFPDEYDSLEHRYVKHLKKQCYFSYCSSSCIYVRLALASFLQPYIMRT